MPNPAINGEIKSGRRILQALKLLPGNAMNGLSNQELAQALGTSAPQVTRIMATLVAEGLATKLDSGRYAPGVALLGMAQRHADEMNHATARVAEINQRTGKGGERKSRPPKTNHNTIIRILDALEEV